MQNSVDMFPISMQRSVFSGKASGFCMYLQHSHLCFTVETSRRTDIAVCYTLISSRLITLWISSIIIHEEIKSRLKSGNAFYHLSSSLLSKGVQIKIYRTIILPVLCGYETWSLTFREECRLRVFENMVLKRLSGRDNWVPVTRTWRVLRLRMEERSPGM